jgi:hypothetical protein
LRHSFIDPSFAKTSGILKVYCWSKSSAIIFTVDFSATCWRYTPKENHRWQSIIHDFEAFLFPNDEISFLKHYNLFLFGGLSPDLGNASPAGCDGLKDAACWQNISCNHTKVQALYNYTLNSLLSTLTSKHRISQICVFM